MKYVYGALAFATVFILVLGWFMFNGPHMLAQPSLRAYQAQMPPPPANSVPLEAGEELPTVEQAAGLLNGPVPYTPENIARGKVYYGYYACQSCHGGTGAGDGPVGQSFIPVPADLRSPRVRAMTDGQLLRAMLTGPGHTPAVANADKLPPVLEYTVQPEHRWYLVQYVRSLARGN